MKRFDRGARALTLAVLLPLLPGCYHYVRESSAPIPQGTPIRIRLSRLSSFELPSLTAHNVGTVTAEMIREDNGDVVVSTLWLDAAGGAGFSGENWTVRIPRADIAELSIRRVSRWRTALVFIGGITATYFGFHALGGGEAGSGQGGGTNTR